MYRRMFQCDGLGWMAVLTFLLVPVVLVVGAVGLHSVGVAVVGVAAVGVCAVVICLFVCLFCRNNHPPVLVCHPFGLKGTKLRILDDPHFGTPGAG